MSTTDLLKYGKWSGPGWTAGMPADFFSIQGLERRITDADRAVDGIDHYDNFVAKAHDLNEFEAQDALREVLEPLGLVDNAIKKLAGGSEAYTHPLILGAGAGDLKRFVSFDQYLANLLAQTTAKTKIAALCEGFVLYFMHISYSNVQFAIDQALNHVDFIGNIAEGSFRMGYQLRIAPHWFLKEASNLELKAHRIELDHGVSVLGTKALTDYLSKCFIAPTGPYFKPVKGEGRVAVLTRDALLKSTRDELDDIVPALLAPMSRYDRKTIARKVQQAKPDGFERVADLLAFLDALT